VAYEAVSLEKLPVPEPGNLLGVVLHSAPRSCDESATGVRGNAKPNTARPTA